MTPLWNPGDRLRLRSSGPQQLVIERGSEALGGVRLWVGETLVRVGDEEYLFATGDGWDVDLCRKDGSVVAHHDDRARRDDRVLVGDDAYVLEMPTKGGTGELRHEDGRRAAELTLRLPEHGAVVLATLLDPLDDAVLAFVAVIALLRGRARRNGSLIPGETKGKAWDRTIEYGIAAF